MEDGEGEGSERDGSSLRITSPLTWGYTPTLPVRLLEDTQHPSLRLNSKFEKFFN